MRTWESIEMTTYTHTEPRNTWIYIVITMILLVTILSAVLPLLPENGDQAHAGKRGLPNYERARNCRENKNGILFKNPANGRFGKVCLDADGWFVVIMDYAKEMITGFPKEKLHAFEQVKNYMLNSGYYRVIR